MINDFFDDPTQHKFDRIKDYLYKLKEKQKTIVDELKLLSSFTNKMYEEIGAINEIIVDKEQLDLNNSDYSEDDFSEALIVYICSIKESLCSFSDTLSDLNSKL